MIFSKSKAMTSKILAGFLALIMLVSIIPLGTFVTAFAATIDSYTVSLTDGTDIIALDDVKITIKNKNDVEKVLSQSSKNGIATFNNFIEEDETYIVSIDSIVGYKNVADFEITPTAGESNKDVALTAIGKITISGKVVDENDVAYSGASVAISGYTNATTTTNASGEYSFEVYEGQNYTIKATAKEAKYEEKTTTITNPTKDYTCDTLKFAVKQFTIATTAGNNGTITPTESVEYGSNKVVKAVANDGYRIESYKVDGQEQSAAKGEKEYAYTFSNITEAHKVDVSFIRQTYKITFTVSENGKVTYNDGTDQEVTGGSVNIEKIFNESTDPANPTKVIVEVIPNPTYRVSKISYKGDLETDKKEEKNYTQNNKSLEGSEAITLEMNKNYTFEAEFALNQYDINIANETDKGTVTVSGSTNKVATKANYGDELKFQIKNTQGYIIKEVKVNDVTTAFEYDNDAAAYVVIVKDVSDTINFNVSYGINDKLYSFKDNVKLEIKNGTKSIVFNDGANELNSISELKSSNTDGLVVKTEGNTIVLKSGSEIVFTNKNKDKRGRNQNIELQFVYSQFETNDKGWYNPRSNSVIVSKSCELTNVQVKPNDRNTINPQDAIKASEQPIKYTIVIDNDVPEISVPESEFKWTNANNVEITGTVTDKNEEKKPSSGLAYIVWNKDATLNNDAVLNATENKVLLKSDGKFSFTSVDGEQNSLYYIYAVDIAGNVSDAKSVSVRIDRKDPTVTAFTYSTSETSVVEDFISFLTFGTVSSKSIYVTVTGADEDITSGLKEITLYKGSDVFETKTTTGNTATFKLTEAEFKNGAEISATVTDIAGNVSNNTKPTDEGVTTKAKNNTVKIDTAKPEATIQPDEAVYTDGDGKLWYNGNTALNIVATDNNAGICSVEIKLNGESLKTDVEGKAIDTDFSAVYTTSEKFVINTAQNAVDGENVIEVIVTNNAGVQSETKIQKVYIDTTAPDITNFEVTRVGGKALDKILNFLTFGIFFNDQVEVTVTAADSNATSGVKTVTLFAGEKVFETKNVENDKVTFVIPTDAITDETKHFDAVISAKATDNTGNTTQTAVEPNTENSNVKDSGLMIETIKPTIDVEFPEAVTGKNNNTATAGDWYNSDVKFAITANDADAGLRNVLITINDKELVNDNLYASEKITSKEYEVNTADAVRADDGSYTLKVIVTDNAGNVSDTYSKTIFKDVDKPYITGFDFAPDKYIEGSETKSTVEVTDYGFYFKADTKVTISSKDDAPTAGVKSITYYTVDIDSGKSEEITELVNKDNCIDFTIKANFKGQIYAKATDNVLNVASDFVNPDSAIVESPEKHEKEEHIAFSKSPTEHKTQDETELYSKDVPVTLTVTDTYSGIRNIEWEVVAPYDTENNQSGKVSVNNDKTFGEGSDTDWKQTKTESNLVTEMQKTITVNNNSNDIVVLVKMTDRAGNTSEKQIKFSIDKTNPVIEVEYDNNVPDETYKDIFKANRTATIKITERNFNGKDVIHRITNTDGVIPALSAWEEHKNTENPDETYYTATIAYTADGDYTFDISYSDLADNAAEKFTQHKFTIDKTIPTVVVSYDNNSALNGNYYKADRTATITIVEHNFDSSRVNVVGTATDNGTALSFPATSTWTSNGDTHTATINYSSDSKYTFDIEFLDMAGNSIADYAAEEFFVDKTAPTLEISGVADKSANNGTVAPVVTYSDTNFNKDAINIELSGVSNGKVNYAGSVEDIANGQKFTYADFEKIQDVDDIYTLTATLTDMAGNETTKTIVFSANRFGSVYTFDSFLKSIEGKYTNTEQDVVFTETNVDTLDRESIKLKLIKNGTPSDLKEGNDYTITTSGGNGQWSQYKYVVNKALFADDGNYRLTIYSIDAAGNVNENIDESKKAEISFGIDKTNPVIVPIDFESGKQYPVEVKNVKAEVKDNLVLESVKVYLNGEEIEYKVEGETYTFDIPKSNSKQDVKIVAVDAAGNEQLIEITDFLVNDNFFVRWYNNTPLFIGSIIGVVVIALGVFSLILFGKKKKKDDE